MPTMENSSQKTAAIFELREAAEEKGRNEKLVRDEPSPENRDQYLKSLLKVDEKTARAIAACHECGHEHDPAASHIPEV